MCIGIYTRALDVTSPDRIAACSPEPTQIQEAQSRPIRVTIPRASDPSMAGEGRSLIRVASGGIITRRSPVLFTTGRGTPYGLAEVPVIKIATRSDLARRWHDLMDLDAGRIATGQATIEDVGWDLFLLMLDVASGRKRTWAEHWKLHNSLSLFNPGPIT